MISILNWLQQHNAARSAERRKAAEQAEARALAAHIAYRLVADVKSGKLTPDQAEQEIKRIPDPLVRHTVLDILITTLEKLEPTPKK